MGMLQAAWYVVLALDNKYTVSLLLHFEIQATGYFLFHLARCI